MIRAVQLSLVPDEDGGDAVRTERWRTKRRSRRYGIPFTGSKNTLAQEIVSLLPPAPRLYDLFAGGCAVAHCALLSGKWTHVHVNDIDPAGIDLFMGAVSGRYGSERRVVDRDSFERLRKSDPYVRYCWSFGGNGVHYLWNDAVAGAKLLACQMVLADSWKRRMALFRRLVLYLRERRQELAERRERMDEYVREKGSASDYLRGRLVEAFEKSGLTRAQVDSHLGTCGMAGHYFGSSQWEFPTREKYELLREILDLPEYDFFSRDLENLRSSSQLQSLARLEGLESLRSLENLDPLQRLVSLQTLEGVPEADRLTASAGDYREVRLDPGSVVYCDIPYRGTGAAYCEGFDHDAFYDWAEETADRGLRVYVSEYGMPSDRFECVWERPKTCQYSSTSNSTPTEERLFVPRARMRKEGEDAPQA